MPSTSNVMTVTKTCLSNVSKTLINARRFNRNLLTVRGSVLITNDGTSSQYSSNSFCRKDGFDFKGSTESINPSTGNPVTVKHPIKVSLTGKFVSDPNSFSTFFTLIGNSSVPNSNLRVYLNSTSASIWLDERSIIGINELNIKNDATIQVNLRISIDSITFELTVDGTTYTASAYPSDVSPQKFKGIFVGLDYTPDSPNFWKGSIDLSKLFIYEDNTIYFTPTEQDKINFKTILVAESNIELNDTTEGIAGLAYEFPIEEIIQTGNNITLRTTIGGKNYLTIGKIGLYCEIGNQRYLFSEIKGLSLKKTRDLSYDVTLRINTNISFVNTTIRPEIVLNKYEPAKKKEIDDIKLIFLDSNVKMERAIQLNADLIGYNKAQVFYKHEQDNKMIFDNWFSATAYMKMRTFGYNPKNFFSFIKNTYNSYSVRDFVIYNNLDAIQVVDGSFKSRTNYVLLNGNATLSVLLDLQDLSDQIILSKVKFVTGQDEENIKYFVLSIEDLSLKFDFYALNGLSTISAPLSFGERTAFSDPILISIVQVRTNTGCRFDLYQNSKLIGSSTLVNPIYMNPTEEYVLTNYTDSTDIDAASINLRDILFFDRVLTQNDLYRLKSIFAINS